MPESRWTKLSAVRSKARSERIGPVKLRDHASRFESIAVDSLRLPPGLQAELGGQSLGGGQARQHPSSPRDQSRAARCCLRNHGRRGDIPRLTEIFCDRCRDQRVEAAPFLLPEGTPPGIHETDLRPTSDGTSAIGVPPIA